MELYEKICPLGEGTYGMVMKCKHKETNQIVAIKKFKDSEEDPQIKKTAMREVKMLKNLRHDNVVSLLEVFRRKGKLYLVFEHMDRTILFDIEKYSGGIPDDPSKGDFVRKSMWQMIRGVDFLHSHNVMHRDLKPENILVSKNGIVKLCDFGFARALNGAGAKYTDYVATRWYRAPELLVVDVQYGLPVDVWAIGCIFAELLSSQPLFPGDTDLDQLCRIMRYIGPLPQRFTDLFLKNPYFENNRIPEIKKPASLESKFSFVSRDAMQLLQACFHYEPLDRPQCSKLLSYTYFTRDSFIDRFEPEFKLLMENERVKPPRKVKKVVQEPLPVLVQQHSKDKEKIQQPLQLNLVISRSFPTNPRKDAPAASNVKKSKPQEEKVALPIDPSITTKFAQLNTKLKAPPGNSSTIDHPIANPKGKFVNAKQIEFSLPKITSNNSFFKL